MSETCSCPFAKYLTEERARRAQMVLLWRSPVAVGVTFAITELVFFLVHTLDLNVFGTILLLGILVRIAEMVLPMVHDLIDTVVFPALPADPPELSNRIRSYDEIRAFIAQVHRRVKFVYDWLEAYVEKPTLFNHGIFFGTMFVAFVLFTDMGTFCTVFVTVHFILIVPALWFHPKVRELAKPYLSSLNLKIKTE